MVCRSISPTPRLTPAFTIRFLFIYRKPTKGLDSKKVTSRSPKKSLRKSSRFRCTRNFRPRRRLELSRRLRSLPPSVPFVRNVFPNLRGVHSLRGFAKARLWAGAYLIPASTITVSNLGPARRDGLRVTIESVRRNGLWRERLSLCCGDRRLRTVALVVPKSIKAAKRFEPRDLTSFVPS